jgi:small ubiquitin-related modifier
MENQPNSTGQETVFISHGDNQSFPHTATMNNQENSSNQERLGNSVVTVKVRDQFEQFFFFRVKRSTPMMKIFDAFARKVGLPTAMLKFMRDGERISEIETPASLELYDEDQIDVFHVAVGGENGEDEQEQGENNVTDLLTIFVKDSDGERTGFRVKKNIEFQKIFEAFAKRKNYDLKYIRFTYDGDKLNAHSSPKIQKMEDNDEIQASVQQHGGKE